MRGTLLLCCLSVAAAQTSAPLDADAIRLARIKATMRENLDGLPNYTCLQTIERSQRKARGKRFELLDTLRLEVALVGDKELFSWPGARKFDDRELRDMVGGGGAIGNGAFALHARSVFLSGSARFTFEGERDLGTRRVFAYRFSVPLNLSGYTIRSGNVEDIVAYHGTFLVDSTTLDLIELVVEAEGIPPELQLAGTATRMEYARVPIGSSEFLLPQASELTMTDIGGNESRNRTSLSACKQYSGDSVISFADPPPEEAAPPPPPPEPVELPAGLTITLDLDTVVRYGSAAVGDPLTAVVPYDAKWRGKVIVPKGATVYGHLLRVSHGYARTEMAQFIVEFSELEIHGQRIPFQAELKEASGAPFVGRLSAARLPEHPVGQGALILSGNRLELGKGLRMVWQVAAERNGDKH